MTSLESTIKVFPPEALRTHASSKVQLAVQDAAELYASQYRRYTELPYVTHPYGVAMRLLNIGADEPTLIAALFHSALDMNAGMSASMLRRQYGEEVLSLVLPLTEGPALAGVPRAERKRLYRERLIAAEPRVHDIKLADIIDSLDGIVHADLRLAKVYLPDHEALVKGLVKGHPALQQEARHTFTRERSRLKR
ncbi:guanosine-3',5'-bis(Diphosphate) 3'-pyrophosphohydrolase [Novimethylophilus kurashikiensis]|uniref:Guanosine-3',5'-bis(Diphosphate) 3'-pyrophosphohydrolase n=1 Tax=Novimethylophilus kurashikiensis TaxID=1825523 RepID=A0A2R5FAM1_9PROT|nr:HD domain-containing protein [Novimethylophilus kurashikiensis]GBG14869.1 guanosine-3',5'-bis(Diphosphate) 3'-pyrophosphohydrolase [Novimethylophilus kurashikiensis]